MTPSQTLANRSRRRRVVSTLAAGGLVAALLAATGPSVASAAPAAVKAEPPRSGHASDVREIDPAKRYSTRRLDLAGTSARERRQLRAQAAGPTPAVGTTRTLLASDDYNGVLYRKPYTLQAVEDHIEVWVADDTAFPAGDCRNAVPDSTTVTRAQAEALADQFETNMFPVESQAFSVAPDRDGSGGVVPGVDASGDGQRIMTLVDNVRDDNYYLDPTNAATYIGGFFSSQINELLDRNVMTIDAFDWLHRTGANPPDDVTDDVCTSRPARANLYEATFAHEYQHLLEYYQDPAEVNWVNEGLSDFAESLTGYADATRTVFQQGAQSHIYCFLGFGPVETPYNPNPRDCGGPENSLTLWGDQVTPDSILADYGNAWSFMLFLRDRYGLGFMSTLHRDGTGQGLVGLQDALDGYAPGTDAYDVIHDFQAATLVDRIVGRPRGVVRGIRKSRVVSRSLNSTVNLGNPASYAAAGAPPNGADYVGLRGRSGLYLRGRALRSLSFRGAETLAPQDLQWTSVADPPQHAGDPALWSGNTTNLDAGAVTEVAVPADDPTLTFDELHLAEAGYDYAYTVVSTDGGETYTPLANENTVDGPLGPALNGDATAWATQSFDLSAYAGQSVLIGFRYVSDGGVNDGGWYVDDVNVGDTLVNDGSSTEPFRSPTQVNPVEVEGFNVQVVGVDTARHRVRVRSFDSSSFRLGPRQIRPFKRYPRVVVIVGYDEPTEQVQQQAPYTLTVNRVVQPGGGQVEGVRVRADRF